MNLPLPKTVRRMFVITLCFAIAFCICVAVHGVTDEYFIASNHIDYFVAPDGIDAPGRGSREKPWASLAFACDQVPEGQYVIYLAPGEYVATRTAYPKNGVTIMGRQSQGKDVTRIMASPDWKLPQLVDYQDHSGLDEYLIAASAKRPSGAWLNVKDLTITNLELASTPNHRITGAVFVRDGTNVKLQHLNIHDFRWNGLRAEFSQQVEINDCQVINASTETLPNLEGGLIRTRWISDSRIHHNRIIAKGTRGYGYKGGGHTKVRFDHNYVDTAYFAFESPFENELGLEIDHNRLTRCISIPKDHQEDPTKKGFAYAVRIHHNILNDSYTIEGPRSYLEFDHNWVHAEKPEGRIYSQFGANSRGPIRIHHNVVENLDRSLVWMNEGTIENLFVFNNTIFCADAGDRAGNLLDVWTGERINNWLFKNNVVVAPQTQPRLLHGAERGVPDKISATQNLFVNFRDVPKGNFTNETPGFQLNGDKPSPFYLPARTESFVVNRGVDVGFPIADKAPDLGAFEFGEPPWKLEEIPQA